MKTDNPSNPEWFLNCFFGGLFALVLLIAVGQKAGIPVIQEMNKAMATSNDYYLRPPTPEELADPVKHDLVREGLGRGAFRWAKKVYYK